MKEELERKIRILKSYIEADKRKGDVKALEHHANSLREQQNKLKEIKSPTVAPTTIG